jgi:hypothetical protein
MGSGELSSISTTGAVSACVVLQSPVMWCADAAGCWQPSLSAHRASSFRYSCAPCAFQGNVNEGLLVYSIHHRAAHAAQEVVLTLCCTPCFL